MATVSVIKFRRLELIAWLILVFLAVATRLPGLESRGFSHDESLHAYYSWIYAAEGVYHHDPMMHGPLLFHLDALVFRLLGDTDGSARLLPALVGVISIALAALWRPIIGRLAALFLAVLLLFSPPLLFYSRYLRNEIYVVLCTQLWAYGLWRYLTADDRKASSRWLYLIAAAMAFSFAAKEVTYIHGLVLGPFLVFLTLPIWRRATRLAAANLVFFHLTLVFPLATAVLLFACGVNPLDNLSDIGAWRIIEVGAGLAGLGWIVAALWWRWSRLLEERKIWVRCYLLFWGIQIPLYTALFSDTRHGLASCLAGSLGYWLGQHGVGRGGQPAYYYLILLALYEFLAIGGLIAALLGFIKERPTKNLFIILCLWWFAGNLLIYSLAGEKMPWLLAHISLPLAYLAAWGWSVWIRRGIWGSVIAIIALFLLVPLGVTNALRATFWHGDLATEPLVYAHGSPDHKKIRALIATAEKETKEPGLPVVAYDSECAWPLAWYLRHIPHAYNADTNLQAKCRVIFAGSDRPHKKLNALGTHKYEVERLVLIWWPIEWWKDGNFLRRVFSDPAATKKLWELAVTRQGDTSLMSNWPLRKDVLVFLRKGGCSQNENTTANP